jgi:hypothetical protein
MNAEPTMTNVIISKAPHQIIKSGGERCVPGHPRDLPLIARMKVGGAEELAH